MENTWLSAHLFYAGDRNILLKHLVIPLLESTGTTAFFIRYWEGGPHIRLRLQVKKEALENLETLLDKHSQAFYRQHPSQRGDARYSNMTLQPNDTLQYVAYEPETDRYGHAQCMYLAEQQFVASSRFVLQQINTMAVWNGSIALLHTLRMNIALLYTLQEEKETVLDICRQFIRAWLPMLYNRSKDTHIQEIHYREQFQQRYNKLAPELDQFAGSLWNSIEAGRNESILQQFIDSNHEVFSGYKTFRFNREKLSSITGSFLHMGHNRLGISNLDEAYIMFLTLKCMEQIYDHIYR